MFPGKSTLINALVGAAVLPAGELRWPDEGYVESLGIVALTHDPTVEPGHALLEVPNGPTEHELPVTVVRELWVGEGDLTSWLESRLSRLWRFTELNYIQRLAVNSMARMHAQLCRITVAVGSTRTCRIVHWRGSVDTCKHVFNLASAQGACLARHYQCWHRVY